MDRLTIRQPDDLHLHLRDGDGMRDAVGASAGTFGRAVVMPNLQPPVVRTADAEAYRSRILAALPDEGAFEPLMTLYLTDDTEPGEVGRAAASGVVVGFKLYPAGATTNSAAGVTDLERIGRVLEAMERYDVPLLVHGEVTDPEVDIFDRERVFLERILTPLLRRFEGLRVVLEHVTTADGVSWVSSEGPRVAGTITPHHLLLNRNALLVGGVRPHHYCLPVLKRERHRRALVAAATGSSGRFFLGTDSAPHPRRAKECASGCAGVFNAPVALAVCAEVFEAAGALDRLEGFVAGYGAEFYRLPPAGRTLTLQRRRWRVPRSYPFGDDVVVPLCAGEELAWRGEVVELG